MVTAFPDSVDLVGRRKQSSNHSKRLIEKTSKTGIFHNGPPRFLKVLIELIYLIIKNFPSLKILPLSFIFQL